MVSALKQIYDEYMTNFLMDQTHHIDNYIIKFYIEGEKPKTLRGRKGFMICFSIANTKISTKGGYSRGFWFNQFTFQNFLSAVNEFVEKFKEDEKTSSTKGKLELINKVLGEPTENANFDLTSDSQIIGKFFNKELDLSNN